MFGIDIAFNPNNFVFGLDSNYERRHRLIIGVALFAMSQYPRNVQMKICLILWFENNILPFERLSSPDARSSG